MSQINIFTCIITATMKLTIKISTITMPHSSSSLGNTCRPYHTTCMSNTPTSHNLHYYIPVLICRDVKPTVRHGWMQHKGNKVPL